jgi:hypothetical protein
MFTGLSPSNVTPDGVVPFTPDKPRNLRLIEQPLCLFVRWIYFQDLINLLGGLLYLNPPHVKTA